MLSTSSNPDVDVCAFSEPRRTVGRECEAVCAGDGDRSTRHSVRQPLLHAAAAQTASRRGAAAAAGDRHSYRQVAGELIRTLIIHSRDLGLSTNARFKKKKKMKKKHFGRNP